MDDEGWEGLPGSRRPTQIGASKVAGAGFGAALMEGPLGLLLLPLIAPFVGAAHASDVSGGVEVSFSQASVRRGRRRVSFDRIEAARLLPDPNLSLSMGVHLQLEAPKLGFRVPIHDGYDFTLKKRAREMLLELLPHTSIEMPTSHYDPKGKFAKYNFPSHITKDEAIALMQKPPKPGDPLPIPG